MKEKRSIYSRVILITLIASQIILFGSRCFSKEWSQTFGGSSHDAGFSVKQTTDGGYIIAGYRDYELSQDVGDVWLIKTDADGNLQWERSFGGAYWDTAFSVQLTSDGGYIIAGEKDFAGTWDPRSDAFLIKTDANGSIQWELTFDRGSWRDWFRSVQLTTDGGYIAAGATSNGWGLEDVYLVKIDSDGTVQWEQTFGGDWTDYAESIQQTSDGGYIMVGQYDRRYTYLVKTDSYGNIQWEKTFGDSDLGFSVLQATDGGYIVLARTVSIGAGGEDAWLAKTDANGNLIWEQTFGGSASDNGRSFQQTVDGGYVIAGHTASFGAGSNDVWLIKTDANGNELWNKTFGGGESDSGISVQQTTDGGYIITGNTESFGAGGRDVYLIYYKKEISVDINIHPKVLNLKSKGRKIISGIRLSEEYNPHDIARDSLELSIPTCSGCEVIFPTCGFPLWKRYLAFFPRQDLIDEIETMNLELPTKLDLKITGELDDGTPFEGLDTIRVIERKKWTKRK